MALSVKWMILCALSLLCVARFGSCRRNRHDGAQPELFIFNELCALKDEPGPCKAILERYFFNVDTGACESFEYGGCGGNANNFLTLEQCEETCVVSEDKNPCHLDEAPGPCRGMVKRFFFDSRTQQCKHFYYGGCFGNANNFRSMRECVEKCQSPEKPTKVPEVHTLPDPGSAAAQPTNVVAELMLFQPQVQLNHTTQEKQVVKPKGCLSPMEQGSCDGAQKRFFYNSSSRRCHIFNYSGCGGNENNFKSRKLCIRKCIRGRKGPGTMMIRIRRKNLDHIAQRTA